MTPRAELFFQTRFSNRDHTRKGARITAIRKPGVFVGEGAYYVRKGNGAAAKWQRSIQAKGPVTMLTLAYSEVATIATLGGDSNSFVSASKLLLC